MKSLALITAIAILLEALVEYGKSIYKLFMKGERKAAVMQCITIALGVFFAFLFNLNMFIVLEIEVNAVAGMILTGIVISRGSNYASDLIAKIRGEEKDTTLEWLETLPVDTDEEFDLPEELTEDELGE